MPQQTFDQAMRLALDLHRAERYSEAELAYRQIISRQPNHGHALHMLGVLVRQSGRAEAAVDLIQRAIAVLPPSPEIFVNLGGAMLDQNNFNGAIAAFSKAGQLRPTLAEAHCGLGAAHLNQGRHEAAISACNRAIELKPEYSEAYNILGSALRAGGHLDASIAAYAKAVQIAPNFEAAFQNLGIALRERGRAKESIIALRRAVRLRADNVYTQNSLGMSLTDAGEMEEAIASFQNALRLQPHFVEALNNLAMTLRRLQRLDDAIATLSRAIELSPTCAPCLVNLGSVWKDKGDIDRALTFFRKAVAVDPQFELVQSNVCYAVHFDPSYTPPMILAEHREWARRFAEPLAQSIRPHDNDPSTTRRLKIGYVSPDFRLHPVGRFLLPLLLNHDKGRFEIHCYSDVRRPDAMTAQLKSCCDVWHETAGLSDEALAQSVRNDQIDILVDLTLHLEGSRLLAFARKPAPVQVTWLGYASTTGLAQMDYRISDPILDPPGTGDENYVEKTVRIASYWCYAPIEPAPDVVSLPALAAGHVTFGSFNEFSKVSPVVLDLWAQILQKVNGARLLIHALPGRHREQVIDVFRRAEIESSRIAFIQRLPVVEYLKQYQQIDIALDTSPYGGGTTTCDAHWMGVPVVTLLRNTAVGRGSASLLNQLGLQSLIADRPEQYVSIAVQLAGDLQNLARLRQSLRQRMMSSPLMDAPRFARSLETALIEMWQTRVGRDVK